MTNGGSEANCIALMHLVEPGDEVVMMMPNYMQVRGLARGLGRDVRPWPLVEDADAALAADLDALGQLVTRAHQADPDLQSEQPHRRPFDRAGARRNLPDRRPGRRMGLVRRDLSRRGARRRRDADGLGPVRARDRHERAVEGVRAARAADRLGRRAAGH